MLKKYILLFLLPLSMTSFGQSLHAEQDASENTQQALEKEIQQAPKKETVIKNLDLEKASLRSRFFAGSLTLLIEGILGYFGGMLIVIGTLGEYLEKTNLDKRSLGVKYAFKLSFAMILNSLIFSVFAGFMSFNAPLKLKIVDKNGEDTTFKQRFWYAFSFFLLPFVLYIVEAIVLYFCSKLEDDLVLAVFSFGPIFLTLIAQGALVGIKKKTISEYVTGLQVVKKKPSAPVQK